MHARFAHLEQAPSHDPRSHGKRPLAAVQQQVDALQRQTQQGAAPSSHNGPMASAALSPRGASGTAGAHPRQSTIVTRERVIAPPERFITASDEQLVAHFKGELCADNMRAPAAAAAHAGHMQRCRPAAPPMDSSLAAMGPRRLAVAPRPDPLPQQLNPPPTPTPHHTTPHHTHSAFSLAIADKFDAELAPAVPVLHELVESICTSDFAALRRQAAARARAARQPESCTE